MQREPRAPAFDAWAPFYDLTDRDVAPFIAFYRGVVTEGTRSLLDLGCGTGTIAIALASRLAEHPGGSSGVRVVGLDESPEMLRVAGSRDPTIEWVVGDMRSPPLEGPFDLVVCCYNTLQHLRADDDLARTFRGVRRLLAADGIFAFDIYQPNVEWLDRARTDIPVRSVTDDHGRRLELLEDRHYDARSRILTTDWRLVETGEDGAASRARIRHELRQYFRSDLDRLLAVADLAVHRRYGDLDRSPFTPRSRRQVLVCRPA
jgi:SAM-dependent methyltransferase